MARSRTWNTVRRKQRPAPHETSAPADPDPAASTRPAPGRVFDAKRGSRDSPVDPGVEDKIKVLWKLDHAYYRAHIESLSDFENVMQHEAVESKRLIVLVEVSRFVPRIQFVATQLTY